MSKIKVQVDELVKGMYICELDRPWSETTFLFQGFRITNEQEIETLQNTCSFVYVDQGKSKIHVSAKLEYFNPSTTQKQYETLEPLHDIEVKIIPYPSKFEDEFPRAKTVYMQASEKVNQMIKNLRLGQSLDVFTVKTTVQELTGSILRNPDALKLLCAIQERDQAAANHALHVCVLTLAFAYYLGFKNDVIQELGIGALLHDIGETKLPEGLFWSSEIKDEKDREELKKHVEYGVEIIQNTPSLPPVVLDIVRDHHERLNGTGYPRHACGSEINYNAMLVSMVDVYDNVTMGYEGKNQISCTAALKSMYDWRDELFQSDLIEHFIQCLGIYPIGSVVKLNTGEVGIVITFDDCSRLTPRVMLLLDKNRKQYDTPRILNLSQFKDSDDRFIYEIERVVSPEEYGIDIRHHILRELYSKQAVNQ